MYLHYYKYSEKQSIVACLKLHVPIDNELGGIHYVIIGCLCMCLPAKRVGIVNVMNSVLTAKSGTRNMNAMYNY